MLQEGGLYPGIRTAEVLDLFAAYYDDPADPAALLERVGPGRPGQGDRPPPVRRPAAAPGPGPRPGRPAPGRLPRRAHRRPRRRRPPAGAGGGRGSSATPACACSWPPTTWPRPRRWPTGSSSSTRAGSWPTARRPSSCSADRGRDPLRRPARPRRRRPGRGARRAGERGAPTASTWSAAEPSPRTVAALTAWLAERDLALGDLRAGRQHLEDVFVRLTREEAP